MFESFSDRSREIMNNANELAIRAQSAHIDVPHVLAGLLRLESGVAITVLRSLAVDLNRLRERADGLLNRAGPTLAESVMLPHAKRVTNLIIRACDEMRRLQHYYVGSEHILLALWREQEGPLADVLAPEGILSDTIRDEIERQVRAGADDRE